MNNNDIKKARKKHKKLIEEKAKIQLLKKELSELENNSIVKRYLELQEIANKNILNDTSIIRYSFSETDTSTINNNEKIYIYLGAYKYDSSYDSRSDFLQDDKDLEYADYLLYVNIDNSYDSISIKPKYKEIFEKKYNVLKFKNTINIQKKYYDLQQYYFSELLNIDLRKKNKILTLLKDKINKKAN